MSEICELQQKDPDLISNFEYFEQGVVPTDDRSARKLVMECKKYELIDGVLHFENHSLDIGALFCPKQFNPLYLRKLVLVALLAIYLNERSMITYDALTIGKE